MMSTEDQHNSLSDMPELPPGYVISPIVVSADVTWWLPSDADGSSLREMDSEGNIVAIMSQDRTRMVDACWAHWLTFMAERDPQWHHFIVTLRRHHT